MEACVKTFNESVGLGGPGSPGVVYRSNNSSLELPPALVQRFFEASVKPTCEHMCKLLDEAKAAGTPISFVFLVGGFAGSPYLRREVEAAIAARASRPGAGPRPRLVTPVNPVRLVVEGAALWGLFPNVFITSRKMQHSYAVVMAKPLDSSCEPLPGGASGRHKYIRNTDRGVSYVDNVLMPLIQKDKEVKVDETVKESLVPVDDSQTEIALQICR
jgi:molecular chaperone DnaK (HSP70)